MPSIRNGDVRPPEHVLPLLSRRWRPPFFESIIASVAYCLQFVAVRRCVFVVYPTSGQPIVGRHLTAAYQCGARRFLRIVANADPGVPAERLKRWTWEESTRWTWSLHCVPPTPHAVCSFAEAIGCAHDSQAVADLARLVNVAPEHVTARLSFCEDDEPTVLVADVWRMDVEVVGEAPE